MVLMALFTVGNVTAAFAPTLETLVAARFLAGIPHGAYFGVASLVAATLAGAGKQARAVAQVMLAVRGERDRRARGHLARGGWRAGSPRSAVG